MPGDRRGRVLVVDADASYRDALVSGLKSEDFFVRFAVDGKSALHAFGNTAPDLVLLDMRLLDMSGTGVCRELAHLETVPGRECSREELTREIVAYWTSPVLMP
ncbi:MAG: response regulator transcription factor [Acidimicrobiales bacterium]